MSLVGFRARNHPQQVEVRGVDEDVDERVTPAALFLPLQLRHGFTLDAAASPDNAKVERFYSRQDSALVKSWAGEVVWCNPPYSDLDTWVRYARLQVRLGCRKVVLLLPANRTEQRWWQEDIEPDRDRPGSGVAVHFLPGRINFGKPGNEAGRYRTSAPFGCCLVTLEPPRAVRQEDAALRQLALFGT